MFIVNLVVDRQLGVRLTQAERERNNEKELTCVPGLNLGYMTQIQMHRPLNHKSKTFPFPLISAK